MENCLDKKQKAVCVDDLKNEGFILDGDKFTLSEIEGIWCDFCGDNPKYDRGGYGDESEVERLTGICPKCNGGHFEIKAADDITCQKCGGQDY